MKNDYTAEVQAILDKALDKAFKNGYDTALADLRDFVDKRQEPVKVKEEPVPAPNWPNWTLSGVATYNDLIAQVWSDLADGTNPRVYRYEIKRRPSNHWILSGSGFDLNEVKERAWNNMLKIEAVKKEPEDKWKWVDSAQVYIATMGDFYAEISVNIDHDIYLYSISKSFEKTPFLKGMTTNLKDAKEWAWNSLVKYAK